ncbi:MAG: hypothetical protein ABFD92_19275 [Planctomycetaceae bacterium]|nr:hypothetical protein [Planctomycetaceae bacterium]
MRRLVLLLSLIFVCPALSSADQVVTSDGRTFSGKVTVEGESVTIEMPYGSLTLLRSKVARIEIQETPEEQLAYRLKEIDPKSETELLGVGLWAARQGLDRQARKIFQQVLDLNAENLQARQGLGYARIDNAWVEFDKAVELARSRLEAGDVSALTGRILPAIRQIARGAEQQILVDDLAGQAQLRGGNFNEAAKIYAALGAKGKDSRYLRFAAIAEILTANADGMYVLTEPYPPSAGLMGRQAQVQAGPASLSRPIVVEAALKDLARRRMEAGKKLLAEAKDAQATNKTLAENKFTAAAKSFEAADALVPDITRSYRVEITRLRIVTIRQQVDADAKRFDAAMAALGNKNMSKNDYRESVMKLIHHVNAVRGSLTEIMELAKPYRRELVLEIQWAQADLKKLTAMRDLLVGELDDAG